MQKRTNQFFVFMTVFAVLVTSFINPTTAYADDGTNTGGEEQQPIVEETLPAETVAEIIEQIPEGTLIIVVGEDGVEPLASEEAAQVILESDPIWCPTGQNPGNDMVVDSIQDCTNSYTTVTDLISNLGSKSGSGTIYFTPLYNVNDATFDQTNSNLANLTDLTIEGGWNGLVGAGYALSGTTSFSGASLTITNWVGNITLNDLVIDAEDADAGLFVETTGNITLNNITSSGNSLGLGADLNTCSFDGVQCTGTGNVAVNTGTFNNNGGTGIRVDSGGTIDLNTVIANGNNNAGAILYNHDLIGIGGVSVTSSIFNANHHNGIYVYADDTITLTNTQATNNGFDGADLINYEGRGDITVTGGNFSYNVLGTGLYIDSAGNITVTSVTANDNRNGATIFGDFGGGSVNVTGSDFNDNEWSGLQVTSNGDITLEDVDASNNSVGGVYLNALGGSGNIFIVNDAPVDTNQFNGNGQYGIHVFANGDITLENVTVNGVGTYTTDNGAWLKSFEGNVFVSNSIFTNNTGYGLLAVAAVQIDLVNVTATFNGADGVAAYSIYSFACFGNDNILINVNSGVYTDNGGYGIYAYPGELGSFSFSNSPTFVNSNNELEETFLELLSNPCPEPEPKPEPEPGEDKPSNEVEVPEDGTSGPVEQDCELYSSTTFKLHSGTTIKVDCPFEGDSEVIDTPEAELPDDLPVGLTFADAVTVGLDSEGNPITVLDDGLITLTFKIPEDLIGKRLSILYWDPTAKDGQGDWMELPFAQFGGAYFPLYPDNPDDGRLLCSGFVQSGDTVTVTVNFPGTFVLVAR